MKKIKLSQINVNALTLNGQQGTYYDHRKYGLGENIDNIIPIVSDYNADLETGFYATFKSALNKPNNSNAAVLIHMKRNSNLAYQIVIDGSSMMSLRSKSNNVWSSWREI